MVGALAVLLAPALAHAAEYYVSPTGSDSAAGTSAAPFATLSKANSAAGAGDTIWVHGGTYYITSQLTLSKSGTSDTNRTKIWAVAGETPVLDISRYNTTNTAADVPAVLVTGNWMHLRGLEIANAKVGASGDHSYSLLRTKNASNNTFELLNLHDGFGPGLFIDTGNGGNLILNCDSHDNYDVNGSQGDGQNGDGFGVHYQTSGPSTIIRGCRAWNDSDDGYDLISQEVPVTIEDSFAISNGRGAGGNGNGFKIGSSQTGIRHIVRNNVAWKNKAAGFYANHSTGGNTWYNNTSYMNSSAQYNMLASSFDSSGNVTGTITLSGGKAHIMRNNIGFPNKNSNMGGVDTMFNTWDLNITEASTDFASTSDTGCTGPREADGSMPAACTFMHLKAGSPLIDKGTNVESAVRRQRARSRRVRVRRDDDRHRRRRAAAAARAARRRAAAAAGAAGSAAARAARGGHDRRGAAARRQRPARRRAARARRDDGRRRARPAVRARPARRRGRHDRHRGHDRRRGHGRHDGTAGTTGAAGSGVITGTAGTTGAAGSGVTTGTAGSGVTTAPPEAACAGNGPDESGAGGCSCNTGSTSALSPIGLALLAAVLMRTPHRKR